MLSGEWFVPCQASSMRSPPISSVRRSWKVSSGAGLAVASLPFHAMQVLDGNPVSFVGSPGSFGGFAPSGSRAREVFLPAVEIEVRGKAARLRARHSYGSPSGGSMSDA